MYPPVALHWSTELIDILLYASMPHKHFQIDLFTPGEAYVESRGTKHLITL